MTGRVSKIVGASTTIALMSSSVKFSSACFMITTTLIAIAVTSIHITFSGHYFTSTSSTNTVTITMCKIANLAIHNNNCITNYATRIASCASKSTLYVDV